MENQLYRKTILIVDDAEENIDILNALLSKFNRKAASSGKMALEIVREDFPDLVLLDIDMPEMNGFEVCKALKEDPHTRNIPIIFLTGNSDKKTIVAGFKLGASDFVAKPFDPEELMVRITTQLELTEARERLERMVSQMEASSVLLKQSYDLTNRQKKLIDEEREKSNKLLHSMLPHAVVVELREKGNSETSKIELATILFADIVDFTRTCRTLTPKQVTEELSILFSEFDTIMERNQVEKIKTIGDGYMAAGGLPIPNGTNPFDVVTAALEMLKAVENVRQENLKKGGPQWKIRVGIHSGEVIAGVLGKTKFSYDVWGETVNIASRLESNSEAGKVNVSGITYQLIKDKFKCTPRGTFPVKSLGKMDMYFVDYL